MAGRTSPGAPVTLYIYDVGDDATDLHFAFTENRFLKIGTDVG
ncbi:hypothetical protein ACVINI_006585 [Rhizobium beringeri]